MKSIENLVHELQDEAKGEDTTRGADGYGGDLSFWDKLEHQTSIKVSKALQLHRIAGSIQYTTAILEVACECDFKKKIEKRLGLAIANFHALLGEVVSHLSKFARIIFDSHRIAP